MPTPYPLPLIGDPPLSNRFLVVFFHDVVSLPHVGAATPNPLDVLFRKVSGIGSTIELKSIVEGGQNTYMQQTPKGVKHDNLVLERGVVVPSILTTEFELAMTQYRTRPCNVLVSLLNASGLPVSSWMFLNALPYKWKLSEFDADANSVVIETMELTYQQRLTLSNVVPT